MTVRPSFKLTYTLSVVSSRRLGTWVASCRPSSCPLTFRKMASTSASNGSSVGSGGRTVICFLRNDLRYHDNEALQWAHRNGDYVLPVYCFDPSHFAGTRHFGFEKTAQFRAKFL